MNQRSTRFLTSCIAFGIVLGAFATLENRIVPRFEKEIRIASRYPMRARTPGFFDRSKASYAKQNGTKRS